MELDIRFWSILILGSASGGAERSFKNCAGTSTQWASDVRSKVHVHSPEQLEHRPDVVGVLACRQQRLRM